MLAFSFVYFSHSHTSNICILLGSLNVWGCWVIFSYISQISLPTHHYSRKFTLLKQQIDLVEKLKILFQYRIWCELLLHHSEWYEKTMLEAWQFLDINLLLKRKMKENNLKRLNILRLQARSMRASTSAPSLACISNRRNCKSRAALFLQNLVISCLLYISDSCVMIPFLFSPVCSFSSGIYSLIYLSFREGK